MPVSSTSFPLSPGELTSPSSMDAEGFSELLGPMLAGAQARGVADAFELLGIGAALIDPVGRVLHMSSLGRRAAAGWLRVIEDHLVADRTEDNSSLQQLIGAAIGETSREPLQVRLHQSQGNATLAIRALRFPRPDGPDQLLHAVLVFEDVTIA